MDASRRDTNSMYFNVGSTTDPHQNTRTDWRINGTISHKRRVGSLPMFKEELHKLLNLPINCKILHVSISGEIVHIGIESPNIRETDEGSYWPSITRQQLEGYDE